MWEPNWQGYNWGTGSFLAEDATYALNLNNMFGDNFYLALDGVWYVDTEFDPEDIDNPNYEEPDPNDPDEPDGHMDTQCAYMAYGVGLNGKYDFTDEMGIDFNIMMTGQAHDEDLADPDGDNIVDEWADWWPSAKYTSYMVPSGVLSFLTTDPFDNGFSPCVQIFYIDHNYISYWGSRREHDLLLIDGGIDGIRDTYGSRLGLNTFLWGGDQIGVRHKFRDNDFLRLGEGLVESPVGYLGGTFDFIFDLDAATIDGQFNYISATDNTGGKDDEDDPLYDGDGDMYMAARDFSGMVADLCVTTQAAGFDFGIDGRYGQWTDERLENEDADDFATTAMVIELIIGKQLTNALNFEFRPRYQTVEDTYYSYDVANDEWVELADKTSDIVISHKWVYNFGGFDFWLRGEHLIRTDKCEDIIRDTDTEEFDFSSCTIHAAWEVKF
jgi:hypothetical protein